jgi:hypothetical protein
VVAKVPMLAIATALLLTALFPTQAARADTQVTTYVIKTQDEREQTRWTLTEWLRIKERMKMMDVWLAMFSDPKKDVFQPELMLGYDITRSHFHYSGASATEDGTLSGSAGKAQIWLTNLISSTVGIRTLNVDLGIEGERRTTDPFASTSSTLAPQAAVAGTAAVTGPTQTSSAVTARKLESTYYTGDLRIFGKNIQDSSIVLKYGEYTSTDSILDEAAGDTTSQSGNVAGAELQLYILRFLGAEGNYLKFGNSAGVKGSASQSGEYYDYMGFVEVSLLRLTAGVYGEDWTVVRNGQSFKTQEKGSLAGVKLQF